MISELINANGKFLVPLALLAGATALAKGLFSLHRARSQSRKEFLELWRSDHSDDLWLEVAVRHLVGAYLPASVIRMLRTSPQAGRALLEVAGSWSMIEMNDETGEISWRKNWYAAPAKRNWWRFVFGLGYFVSFGAGLFVGYLFVVMPESPASLYWVFPLAGMCIGLWCLYTEDRLKAAGQAVPRWLGLP